MKMISLDLCFRTDQDRLCLGLGIEPGHDELASGVLAGKQDL